MRKTISIISCTAFALSAFGGVASANEGNAYGHGCTLSNNSQHATPGKMFKAITTDPNRPEETPKDVVDRFPHLFASVGDLISQKCGN